MSSEMSRLTTRQRELIRSSHGFMTEYANKNGHELFIRLFAEHPDYKNVWPQFRAITDSAIISSDQLKCHGTVYMEGLQLIVDAMDDETKLEGQMKKIAGSHVKWNIYKYHIEHMIPCLLDVLNKCMSGGMNQEVAEAWTTLYDIIGTLINQQKMKNKKQPLT